MRSLLTTGGLGLVTVGALGLALACPLSASATEAHKFDYHGSAEAFVVPDGVTSILVDATGGAGGSKSGVPWDYAGGAQVQGTLAVTPGETLLISVGGNGGTATTKSTDVPGGWGGMGASGGPGNGAKNLLRSSAGGGGATTIQAVIDGVPQTVLVAGGGGGMGAPSGDQVSIGWGGHGGTSTKGANTDRDHPSWAGGDGSPGSYIMGGSGGTAGSMSTMVGARGKGGSQWGGNGGGGGGGVNGGGPGGGAKGTSSGGGGGAGSSEATDLLQNATVNYGGETETWGGSDKGIVYLTY